MKDPYGGLAWTFATYIAKILEANNLNNEADYFYKLAIEKDKTIKDSYLNYATFLAYQGRGKESLDILEKAEKNTIRYYNWTELDYNYTWRPLHIKAVAYCWIGEYEKAKCVFEEAKEKFITTTKDYEEARYYGFFDDYQWLINYLEER